MVYHSNIFFKDYGLIEGLYREKLYITYGKKIHNIYLNNVKLKYLMYFKINYKNYKNYQIKKNLVESNILYQHNSKKKNILIKAYNFLNKNYYYKQDNYNDTSLSNVLTNYLRNKYL
tara:strand:+ start:99 stop:449 length:351 start_codon:yes stop_codon:yes gene_type:complete